MYETEVHNTKSSLGIMYDDIAQKLPAETHKLIFKKINVNGQIKLVFKAIK